MLKKRIAAISSVAFLVAGPGHPTLEAVVHTASRGPVAGMSVIPVIGTGITALSPGALRSPLLMVAPSIVPTAAEPVPPAPLLPATEKAVPLSPAKDSPLAVILSQNPSVGVVEKTAALNIVFDNFVGIGSEERPFAVLDRSAASIASVSPKRAVGLEGVPASMERIREAVVKINDYLDKEREITLDQVEINDLTRQFEYLIGLPNETIPVELLDHLEGLAIATRELFRKGPAGRNVRALLIAAEKLRAKVVADSRTGR